MRGKRKQSDHVRKIDFGTQRKEAERKPGRKNDENKAKPNEGIRVGHSRLGSQKSTVFCDGDSKPMASLAHAARQL